MGMLSFITGLFFGKKYRDSMLELERMKKEDPELKKGLDNFYSNYQALNKQLDEICAKNPDLPNCRDRNK
jgi:hypothetical protein